MRKFDAFISHASEDKAALVAPLARALSELGFKVWYDEFEMKTGDGLRRAIDRGLHRSTFGIVVLSKPFFEKGWTNYELDAINLANLNRPGVLLPIWCGIDQNDVAEFSPSLANTIALQFPQSKLENIVSQLSERIGIAQFSLSDDQLVKRQGRFRPASQNERDKGFQLLSSKYVDRMLNQETAILRTEQVIAPTHDHSGAYVFQHWQYDPGEIELVRCGVYEYDSPNMIERSVEPLEHDETSFKLRVETDFEKDRPLRIVIEIRSKNYFRELFNKEFSVAEFPILSDLLRFEYRLMLPPGRTSEDFNVSVKEGAELTIHRDEDNIAIVGKNLLAGSNAHFQISTAKV